jgi:hypothetical protein
VEGRQRMGRPRPGHTLQEKGKVASLPRQRGVMFTGQVANQLAATALR